MGNLAQGLTSESYQQRKVGTGMSWTKLMITNRNRDKGWETLINRYEGDLGMSWINLATTNHALQQPDTSVPTYLNRGHRFQ